MSNNLSQSARNTFQSTRSIASTVAVIGLASLTLTAAFTSAALAAQSCTSLKAEVSDDGSHLYHYTDPKHPDLDLYRKYVSTDFQCGAGEALVTRYVPELISCELPTCTKIYGESPN